MSERQRSGAGYYLAASLFILLLLAAVAFVVAMVLRPSVEPAQAIVVTDRAPVACPVDRKGTTCYDTLVTNTGGAQGTFSCRLLPAGDTEATFSDATTAKQVTLGASESVHVVSEVTAPGTTPASAPRVLCTTVDT